MRISGLAEWRQFVVEWLCRACQDRPKSIMIHSGSIFLQQNINNASNSAKITTFLWHIRKAASNNKFNDEAFVCSRSFNWTIGGTTNILNGPKNSINRSGKRPKKTTDKWARATFPTFEETWWRTSKHHPAILEPPNSAPWRRRRCWTLLPLS